jgi:XTP/dITP diphosphohydrolase
VRSVVAATANPAKLREMAEILRGLVELEPRPDDVAEVVESEPDLEGNARLKAAAILTATGRAALADDTGLEVGALGGEPGVRSARFAGDDATDADNVALLLARLTGAADRRARFHTVMCLAEPHQDPVFAHGWCDGSIALAPRGDRGFGYDAVFVPDDGDGRTFGEMTPTEKHAVSHRARALAALASALAAPDGAT